MCARAYTSEGDSIRNGNRFGSAKRERESVCVKIPYFPLLSPCTIILYKDA